MKYFCETARCGSLTKAAEQLHLSQPALSRAISALERELGAQLFDRTSRSLSLNELGNMFYDRSMRILQMLDTSIRELRECAGVVKPSLTVLLRKGNYMITRLITSYAQTHPEFFARPHPELSFVSAEIDGQDPDKYQYDLSLTTTPSDFSGQESAEIFREEIVLLTSPINRFATVEHAPLSAFRDELFLMPRGTSNIVDLYYSMCSCAGFTPRVQEFNTGQRNEIKLLLLMQNAVALTPRLLCSAEMLDGLHMVHLNERPSRSIVVSWNSGMQLTSAAKEFIAYAQSFCEEYAKNFN